MTDEKFYEMSLGCTLIVTQNISPLLRSGKFFLHIIQKVVAFFKVFLSYRYLLG